MSTEWLTVEQIAKELQIPKKTIQAWLKSGRLIGYKPGKEYRVKREDLNTFLEQSRTDKKNDLD